MGYIIVLRVWLQLRKKYRIIFSRKKIKTPNNKHFFWNKLYVKVCQTAIHLMEYSPLTINVISYNQYLCVKLEFENYLLLKIKKTSKIICKTAILYYYIKNVCVCRFCHTVSTLLYYYYCFPPNNLWKCQICKQTFVNKQLKFM